MQTHIKCPLCGGTKKAGFTTFTVDYKKTLVVIREVPATICTLCGSEWFSDETALNLEKIVEDAKAKSHMFEVTKFPDLTRQIA